MQFSEIRDIVKTQLEGEGIYRTTTLLNTIINRSYLLIAGMSLFDVRRLNTTFSGTRNRVSVGEKQLVKNGGFEDNDPPDNWTAGNSASLAQYSTDCYAGNNCLTMTENGTANPQAYQSSIMLQAGGKYTFRVWVATGGSGTAYYVFVYDDTTATHLGYESGTATSTWAEVTFDITVPSGSSSVSITLQHTASKGAGTSLMFDACGLGRMDTVICPLYVTLTEAGTSQARRIHPVSPDELEFYSSDWEGTKADQSMYYSLLSPYHNSMEEMAVVPAPLTHDAAPDHNMTVQSLCAVEPVGLSSDTDEPSLPRQFHDMLVKYTMFECYLGEPGRAADAVAQYKEFVDRMDQFIAYLKARFPEGRDYEPFPPEFISDLITRKRQESE